MKNYYDTLGVSEDASNDQIKKAFKSIAKKEHPDRGGNEKIFKEANEAYDTLKDTRKRQEYDTIRKYGQQGTGGNFQFRSGDFFGEEIFENFFSGFDFGGPGGPGVRTRTFRRGLQRNKGINVRMAVSIKEAMNNGFDQVLIDTAGRLQNKKNLMEEYKKIANVTKKIDPNAPHEVLLVLDATSGQNIINQVEEFNKIIPITGLIMTKLDGTAKGGILIAIAKKYKLPIIAIGLGEKEDDLQIFKAEQFAEAFITTN